MQHHQHMALTERVDNFSVFTFLKPWLAKGWTENPFVCHRRENWAIICINYCPRSDSVVRGGGSFFSEWSQPERGKGLPGEKESLLGFNYRLQWNVVQLNCLQQGEEVPAVSWDMGRVEFTVNLVRWQVITGNLFIEVAWRRENDSWGCFFC